MCPRCNKRRARPNKLCAPCRKEELTAVVNALEYWSGDDCTEEEARAAGSTSCKEIFKETLDDLKSMLGIA